MPNLIHPGTKTLTCERCGVAEPEDKVRKTWHCVSTGVLGAVDVAWYCPKCYERTFNRRRNDSSSDESTL